jgi:hypothetical protein
MLRENINNMKKKNRTEIKLSIHSGEVRFCHENAGIYRNLLTANKSFGNVTKLNYLTRTTTNENRLHEESTSS